MYPGVPATRPSRLPAPGSAGVAGDVALVRQRRLRQAEVEHLHRAGGGELDVRRLEIAVDDPLLVRGLERLGDLSREFERLVERQRSARKTIGQRVGPRPSP